MEALAAAMLAAGLASGVHCVGMCGGIVAAFDARGRRVIPVREAGARGPDWARRVAFNLGRITTYAVAGAAAGLAGQAAYAAAALPAQRVLQVAVSLILIVIALHLATNGRVLATLEALGLPLWRAVQPLAARMVQARTPAGAWLAGTAWGFLPCAMVYAALAAAAAAGDPLRGAVAMAAFGAGTLPFLLGAGWLAARIRAWRRTAAALLLGFGAFGLAHAAALDDSILRTILCL